MTPSLNKPWHVVVFISVLPLSFLWWQLRLYDSLSNNERDGVEFDERNSFFMRRLKVLTQHRFLTLLFHDMVVSTREFMVRRKDQRRSKTLDLIRRNSLRLCHGDMPQGVKNIVSVHQLHCTYKGFRYFSSKISNPENGDSLRLPLAIFLHQIHFSSVSAAVFIHRWYPPPLSFPDPCYKSKSPPPRSPLRNRRVSRRSSIATVLSICIASKLATQNAAFAQLSLVFREYIDTFDGYSFTYPANWIPVKGAGADIFFRDPFVLDENLSVDISSPSSSNYKSVEDLGPPDMAAKKILKQYITEFMSTRLGVRRESNIISASSNVAEDGRLYYQVEVNIKSYANTNELAIMPEDRVPRLEWDRRYLSVLGVENNRLYELRLQTPERVFQEEESDLRRVMDSFRVDKSISLDIFKSSKLKGKGTTTQ
ncbi:PsbP domain-containing protein [Drosera capensis]